MTAPSHENGDMDHGMSLAIEKMEIVLLTRQRILTRVDMKVGTDVVATMNAVKYVGLPVDCKLAFCDLTRTVLGKTAKVTQRTDQRHMTDSQ